MPPADVFEVASIKPAIITGKGVFHTGFTVDVTHGVFRCAYCSVQTMILYARNLKKYQVIGPYWIAEGTYMVDARMPAGASSESIGRMIEALLTERFEMRSHVEQRRLPVYALAVGPGGRRFQTALKPATRISSDGRGTRPSRFEFNRLGRVLRNPPEVGAC